MNLPVGTRIRLVKMGEDPCPMEPGAEGTVLQCIKWPHDDTHHVTVSWDGPRALNLVIPPDEIEVIGSP